ncbi:MAG: isopentenyl phosphate kinase family protein [Methanophagales archaeon]|nr:isopentenyl phosphate kinase family protein [Methanophagales archaeon]
MTERARNLIFVKLGGSLITEKSAPSTITYDAIRRIVKELKEAIERDQALSLLIGHGGGSFPHPIAQSFRTSEGFIQDTSVRGFALCQHAASTLNRILIDLMVDYAIDAVSIQPSACCIAKDGAIADFFIEPIKVCMENRIIPVVFGDCVLDTVRGCTVLSTEQIFAHLSSSIRPSRVLIFGLVGGVYTGDPQKDEKARFIPEIEIEKFNEVESYLGDSYSVDVTGGMVTKVKELIKIAKMGIECEVLSGRPGYITKALSGERGLGTIIKPVNMRNKK